MAAIQPEEMKIPVLSVLKNGIVLKNIFLNNPNWENSNQIQEQKDELILIGRHPDCQIVLDHPSISRLHLEIHVNPVLQKLVILDKGSVHGTWVCGKKIEPNVEISLNEGDSLRLGLSTRVYKLHWLSMGCAFEMKNPLPAVLEESEEMDQLICPNEKCEQEVTLQSSNLSSEGKDIIEQISTDTSSLKVGSLEAVDFSLPKEIENQTPEKNNNPSDLQYEDKYKSPLKSGSILSRRSKSKSISSLSVHTGRIKLHENEKLENDTTLCRALFDHKEEENDEVFNSDKENMTPLSSRKLKIMQKSSLNVSATLTVREDNEKEEEENADVFNSEKENMTSFSSKILNIVQKSSSNAPATLIMKEDKEVFTEMNKYYFLIQEEETSEALFQDKENTTPTVSMSNRSKKALMIDFDNVDGDEAFLSDMENITPAVSESRKLKKAPLIDLEYLDGDETFISDKENVTPVASSVKKSKRVLTDSQLKIETLIKERRKERIPLMPLLGNSPYRNPVQNSLKKVDKERVPFQSVSNSPLKNSSPLRSVENKLMDNQRNLLQTAQISPINVKGNWSSSFKESELINSSSKSASEISGNTEESRKKWIMVADTDCFLKEESRKSLQLLEGLRGTQLIIPRIVIRELDCLKRRERYYRNGRNIASSVLKWIEECMVKWSWWIHVQSTLETMPIVPTPPTTPCSTFSDRSFSNSSCFSTCGSLMEVLSPTAEDHIVDCGLLFRKIRVDGHLVLLTDSVTLRIKAMTEGLLCEKPSEFRESLINPYSKRYLWSSSPRTWSCFDDAELIRDSSDQFPVIRNTAISMESNGIKGLKLVLLSNSQYTNARSV